MSTTTTNFGWTVPSDTDLVKDGAAAIRTALGGVDTSFVDLKGGTTGQVLSKASGTDLDFTWVAQDDSNAIQNAIVDAKGDLISATAADTPARLAVGTDGQVLTADSTTSTGLKWATASGGSGPGFAVYMASNQTGMQDSVAVKLNMDTEDWDSDSCYNTTDKRFTPNKAGWYQINLRASSTLIHTVYVYKNGTTQFVLMGMAAHDSNPGSGLVYMNGSTDYIEMWGMVQTANGSMTGGTLYTRFEGFFVR